MSQQNEADTLAKKLFYLLVFSTFAYVGAVYFFIL